MILGMGIDIGYGQTKALSSTGASAIFPSAVGLADPQAFHLHLTGTTSTTTSDQTVCLDGTLYLVGEPAVRHARAVVQPRDRDWLETPPYRILWHAALERVLLPGLDSIIVTGLPVSFYHDRKRLQQVVVRVLEERHATTQQIKVIPQPFGSFFDVMFDPQGQMVDDARLQAHIGLIDVGYFTTDVVEVQQLEYIQKGSGSMSVGVATILDTLRGFLTERMGRVVTAQEAEEVLRTHHVRVRGQEHDMQECCLVAVHDAALAVSTYVRQLWGMGDQFDRILLTGGGGPLVHALLVEQWPQLELTHAPLLANARGYVRYALHCGRHIR